MIIRLGNLQLEDIIEKKYFKKIQNFLDTNGYTREVKCDDIEKVEGNYHIFDMPRLFVICGENKMDDFMKFLQKEKLVGKAFIGQLGLSYYDKI